MYRKYYNPLLVSNEDQAKKINEKIKYRLRRKNNKKAVKRHNDLKYINSNRDGLIHISNGHRVYKTKENQLKQNKSNKKIRQESNKINNIVKENTLPFEYYTNICFEEKDIEVIDDVSNAGYKKIKGKCDPYRAIRDKPWEFFTEFDAMQIPDFNITRNENGQKIMGLKG